MKTLAKNNISNNVATSELTVIHLVGQCNILILGGGDFITDYDIFVPKRLEKRRLLGDNSKAFRYKESDLTEIMSNTKKVLLRRHSVMIHPYKSAFDVASEHTDDFDKLIIMYNKINEYTTSYNGGIDDEDIKSLGIWTVNNHIESINEWGTAFFRSIHIIYSGYIRTNLEFRVDANSNFNILCNTNINGDTSILQRLKSKYIPVVVLMRSPRTDDHIKIMLSLYREMQGKVLPVAYSLNHYTTKYFYAKKYAFLVPYELISSFNKIVHKYGKLADSQPGWDENWDTLKIILYNNHNIDLDRYDT